MIPRLFILAFTTTLAFATPSFASCDNPDAQSEVFAGHYRAGPKTTFYRADGQLADFEPYRDVAALIAALPPDDEMRADHGWGANSAPRSRLPEEQHNVQVTGYIVAVKPGEADNDFHVIVADRQRHTFMNVEVSGLPQNGVDEDEFTRAREEICSILAHASRANNHGSYIKLTPPVLVRLKGSVYFDGDHQAGCNAGCPGPSYAKPTTVWEVHPVYSIEEGEPE